MFRRRHKPSLIQRARDFVWPRIGWWRSSRYVAHRVRRLPGSPWRIAAGFACGVFISFTPLFGLHYLLGGTLAWLLRGSIIASVFGGTLGWLYPAVLIWAYDLGNWVIHALGLGSLPLVIGRSYFTRDVWQAFLPTAIGSLPFALGFAAVSFAVVYAAVANYQRMRRHRLPQRAASRPKPVKRNPQ